MIYMMSVRAELCTGMVPKARRRSVRWAAYILNWWDEIALKRTARNLPGTRHHPARGTRRQTKCPPACAGGQV